MIVADMVDYHCLLGLDFLKYASINIDVRRNELTSKYGTTKFMKHIHQLPKAKTLKCAAITIPANTVMFIHGKLADMNCRDENSYSGFVEPNRNLPLDYGIVVDPALCLTNHRQVPVRVTNLTDLPFYLYKNSTIGKL